MTIIRGFLPPKKKLEPPKADRTMAESMLGTVALFDDLKTTKQDLIKTVNIKVAEIDTKISEVENTTKQNTQKIDNTISKVENVLSKTTKDALDYVKQVKQGEAGKDAEPVDENIIIQKVLKAIPENKASLKIIQETLEVDPMSVIDKILKLAPDKFQLKTDNISGLAQTIRAFQSQIGTRGYLHGGGDTVTAGTNVTITTNSAGQKVISTSAIATGVTALNGMTGAVTLVAGSNITLTPAGNTITISSLAGVLLANGSVPLTGNWNAGAFNITASTFIGALTGNATTATALATGRTISISGDLTYTSPSFDGSANVTAAGTLATVNSNVGTFGSATQSTQITANGKGLITAIANVTITPAVGSITGLGTGVATALAVNVGSAGAFVTFNGALGTPSSGVGTNITGITAAHVVAGTFGTGAYTMDTSLTNPLLIGGTGVTSILSLQGTTGNGTLTSPAIQFLVGNNGSTNAVTVLNNGNVGIGITVPIDLLSLGGVNGVTAPGAPILGIYTNTGTNFGFRLNLESSATGDLELGKVVSGSYSNVMHFQRSTGSVGIGTTTPNSLLSIGLATLAGGDFQVATGGKVFAYGGIATVSNGVPSELATVDLTGQGAAITATTLYTPTASGMFRISFIAHVTTVASVSSILGGTTGIVLTYTEPDGSVAQTFVMATDDQAGAVVVPANGNTLNTTQASISGSAIIYAKTGVAIQYAIGYTSVNAGEMKFSLHGKCEAL